MHSVQVLGVRVNVVGQKALNEEVSRCVREGEKQVFAYVNVHAINLTQRDIRFREELNSAGVVYCDGEGVRFAARLLGVRLPPRVVLTYWIWDLCDLCEREGLSMFLLGATEEVVNASVQRMQKRFPSLKIAGWHHGYFHKQGEQSRHVVDMINHARPDVLFVGFGMPMQELWIADNFDIIRAHAILPCGSMIDYTAGKKSFAPAWMADNGMEWLYRLFQEPGRLWKRYVIGNPVFICKILLQLVKEGRQT